MSRFTDITAEQFEQFLAPQGFRRVDLPGVRELIYAKRVDQNGTPLSLRVYTSIDPSGHGRDVGKDAIRVVLFGRKPDGSLVKLAGSKRVHRVAGWRANLAQRLASVESGPSCPACSSPMVKRTKRGSKNEFYGCSDYPTCKTTRPC